MKKMHKSIFDFRKIPAFDVDFLRKYKPKEGIYINKQELIKSDKTLKLEIDKKIRPSWLVGGEAYIFFPKIYKNEVEGEVLAYVVDRDDKFPAIVKKDRSIIFNFDPEETINFLLAGKYVKRKRPFYTFLPIHYHKIPFRIALGKINTFIRSRFKNTISSNQSFEGSVDIIRGIFLNSLKLTQKKVKVSNFWPNGKRFVIALTHDVDTNKGFKNIRAFSEIEEQAGFISTWFIVGNYYKKDYRELDRLIGKGNEIGLHGYCHDNKIAYLPIRKIEERINRCMEFIKKYNIKGFRSPSLLNSENLGIILKKYFLYDSTIPTNERYISNSDCSGCCSVFPYFKGKMLEIPISIPMDSSLIFLNYSTNSIYNLWVKKLEWIRSVGGVAVLNTHPEPHFSGNKKMLDVYRKFIDYISNIDDAWIATMSEITEHWKKRAEN